MCSQPHVPHQEGSLRLRRSSSSNARRVQFAALVAREDSSGCRSASQAVKTG